MMTTKFLFRTLRACIVAAALCGAVICYRILPGIGQDIAHRFPEAALWYLPWLLFLLTTAAPCFVLLALLWKVTTAIKQERIFTLATAQIVKVASVLLLCDAIYFLIGNTVFALLNMYHFVLIPLSLLAVALGIALAVSAAVLSRYLRKGALLQEEVDTTI